MSWHLRKCIQTFHWFCIFRCLTSLQCPNKTCLSPLFMESFHSFCLHSWYKNAFPKLQSNFIKIFLYVTWIPFKFWILSFTLHHPSLLQDLSRGSQSFWLCLTGVKLNPVQQWIFGSPVLMVSLTTTHFIILEFIPLAPDKLSPPPRMHLHDPFRKPCVSSHKYLLTEIDFSFSSSVSSGSLIISTLHL